RRLPRAATAGWSRAVPSGCRGPSAAASRGLTLARLRRPGRRGRTLRPLRSRPLARPLRAQLAQVLLRRRDLRLCRIERARGLGVLLDERFERLAHLLVGDGTRGTLGIVSLERTADELGLRDTHRRPELSEALVLRLAQQDLFSDRRHRPAPLHLPTQLSQSVHPYTTDKNGVRPRFSKK